MSPPPPEALRFDNEHSELTKLSTLSENREVDEYSESDEDDYPCENCGALMSFEFLYYPDTKTFVGTCTKCGGPSRSSS